MRVYRCDGKTDDASKRQGNKNSKAGPKPYKLSDGGSLYVWIAPTGGKLWRWDYRFASKQKTMTFGKYPDVPLAMARNRHREARATLATDLDPMALRNSEKRQQQISSANSFESVTARWLVHWAGVAECAVDAGLSALDAGLKSSWRSRWCCSRWIQVQRLVDGLNSQRSLR